MRSSLRPHPTSPNQENAPVANLIGDGEGPAFRRRGPPELVAPTEVNRTVAPTRRPNAELRTREHLTPGRSGRRSEPARSPTTMASLRQPEEDF
jgi:hypothetical protein